MWQRAAWAVAGCLAVAGVALAVSRETSSPRKRGDAATQSYAPPSPAASHVATPQATTWGSAAAEGARDTPPHGDTKGTIAVGVESEDRKTWTIALLDDSSGRKVYELPAVPSTFARPLAWSPSGRSLAYEVWRDSQTIDLRVALFAKGSDLPAYTAQRGVVAAWLDDGRVLAAERDAVVELGVVAGEEHRRWSARDLGICPTAPDAPCPMVTGLASRAEGTFAATYESGHVVVVDAKSGGRPMRTRVPDVTSCRSPHFRPGGSRLGVTCVYVPPGYNQSNPDRRRNHYDVNAWVVDLNTRRWSKVLTREGGHEWGARFFPWAPDGSRYVVATYSEAPCSESFTFVSGSGRRTHERVEGTFGSFSPGGDRFVFEVCADQPPGGIFVAQVAAPGPPVRLTDTGRGPLWSPPTF